jgi:hypothetical protein
LLLLDFEIVEMISLVKRRHAGPREECVREECSKLVSQAISNGWIRASNEYLETFKGQQLGLFHDGSDTYLTEEQYAIVKHVGLNFIICLLYFYYF